MSSHHVQTLANSIIGTAILAMPYCFSKCGVILSILLLFTSTFITRCCCHYLIKASIVTRRRNMELLGYHLFSSAGKTMVEISVIGFLLGTCIAFYVVIGDLSPVIVSKVFNLHNFNHDTLRRWLIIIITVVCIIPLSFQKSIESLQFVCRASIGFYICLAIKTIFESFERFQNDSQWASNIELWNPSGVLQCIPIFSMAMSCQMQLFEVYDTMGFPGSSKFDGITKAVNQATFICCCMYSIIGFFGYVAFYNQTLSGNILMNFAPSMANDVITLGFVLSLACSFPLVIFPCRTSLESLLHPKSHHTSETSAYIPESKHKPITLFIIIFSMIFGILIPSVEVIISLVGSTIGVLICVIFPATCFVKIMKRNTVEKKCAQLIILVGFAIMILGTYANLMAIDAAKSGSHLEENTIVTEKIIHPKDIHRIHKEKVSTGDQAIPLLEIPESVKKEKILEAKISADGIKKEELEIADGRIKDLTSKDPQLEIKEKNEEIKELKETKDKLEKEVLEMKEELVKQNKETQQLVMQKFDEIVEKVDKISMENQPSAKEKPLVEPEKPKESEKSSSSVTANILPNSEIKEVNQLNEKINKPNVAPDTSAQKIENSPKSNELKNVPEKNIEPRPDPIVELLKSNYEKSQEPLSYKVGEKFMETKQNQSQLEVKPEALKDKEEPIELHNEIRKKRASLPDELISSIDETLQNLELRSILSRDLKSAPEADTQ